jgi:ABC-type nickel/cobalt efflux system permease component RcnA
MNKFCRKNLRRNQSFPLLIAAVILLAAVHITAHPLGNFTINHFTRIEVGKVRVNVRYVVDMAEIPTFQILQTITRNPDGKPSDGELNEYVQRVLAEYADGLHLLVDDIRVPLRAINKTISLPAGSGGLPTLRVECDFEGDLPASFANGEHRVSFKDTNHEGRIGWHELVVMPTSGVTIFNSTAYGSSLTDELKTYPQNMLAAPVDERAAEFSWTDKEVPVGAVALRQRDGRAADQSRDYLAELIAVETMTPGIAILGLLLAAGLGALHAFSPGHGKTVVGAYLVGSRGNARHAAFLGLTVTITHTSMVFLLGLVTLFASQYVVPERLFPILSFVSGAIVVAIGLSLFVRRLRGALTPNDHDHQHDHHHAEGSVEHSHEHPEGGLTHTHGGATHSHLPPGADGGRVTWKSLLALGISGGLLPCPSALVVLLSAIALHRVGYGLALVLSFSLGLAATLTCIGLVFVYAGRFLKGPVGESRVVRLLPIGSAFVIACVGAVICYEALAQSGIHLTAPWANLRSSITPGSSQSSLASLGTLAVLGLGLVFGLKHATEVDHVVAVSTIVSEHRNILRAALVGALWDAGHTASLIAVGVVVLVLRIAIPEQVANWLEFAVALMIIGLGVSAFLSALRRRSEVHLHRHRHDGIDHAHIHFHEDDSQHSGAVVVHSHAISRIGIKPLLVGAMHGLAGSAALTLLVLTQIESAALGLLYLIIFGAGSIVGMLLMSTIVGLPFALSARRLSGVSYGLQSIAGALSIAFGFWYAYETGVASGLLQSLN